MWGCKSPGVESGVEPCVSKWKGEGDTNVTTPASMTSWSEQRQTAEMKAGVKSGKGTNVGGNAKEVTPTIKEIRAEWETELFR